MTSSPICLEMQHDRRHDEGCGYQRLPSGLLIQWGTVIANDATGIAVVTFPIAFTVPPFSVVSGERTVKATPAIALSTVGVHLDTLTATQFELRMLRADGTVQANESAHWMAVGR